ncbi:hypothetical protein G7043_31305 [Lentzea sp. NEAU-D13]|uniref:Uncharacterized protein n=1 Tax=Lentzea alba TaxID=2714351 RepID=A0A7C9W4R9_9PSEU|nr:hypothetical protein [Lentzea alba]NGY63420.1 hypothetical protein [Lentzea alba]
MDAQVPLAEQSPPAAEPFYTSGTFWTIVGILVAIALGAWAVWAAFRSARPQRALYINVDQAVSLLRAAPGLHGSGIAVSLHGRELTRPYVVTVDVVSDSSLDIGPSAFGEAPLELEFGVPVLALLDQESDAGRPAVRAPKVDMAGTALHISPSLLTRRHRLRYTVLLDGKPDFQPVGDLVDVAVHIGEVPARKPLMLKLISVALLIPAAVLSVLGFVDIAEGGSTSQKLLPLQAGLLVTATIALIASRVSTKNGGAPAHRSSSSRGQSGG